MIGDRIEGCAAECRDRRDSRPRHARHLGAVAVEHVGKNLVQWTRPRCGHIVRVRLTGRWLIITAPGSVDLVAAWRESAR